MSEQKHQSPEQQHASLEAIQTATTALAGEFHEDWRQTRLQEDGSYEPRLKTTKDQTWIEAQGTDQVDIANSAYSELPADWQAENKAAADTVVDLLLKKSGKINLSDETARIEAGNVVHDAWLSRNEWAKGGDLDKPFAELPVDEQDKDIKQVEIAQKLFAS